MERFRRLTARSEEGSDPVLLHFLNRLYTHMEWADALVWRTVLADEAVARDDYVIESLVHIHLVQRAHLAAWQGDEILLPTRDDFGGLDEILAWGRSYHPAAAAFLGQLTEKSLDELIALPWTEIIEKEIGGPVSPARLGELVYQVAAHTVHHRAQITRRIRELGADPPMVDYIGWVWRGKPAAEW